jgi:hypothetical protein
MRYVYFDFYENCRESKMDMLDILINTMINLGELSVYFKVIPVNEREQEKESDGNLVTTQIPTDKGKEELIQQHVIRANCRDNPDCTNLVQSRIAWKILEYHLIKLNVILSHQSIEEFVELETAHTTLWENNRGDLSEQYVGWDLVWGWLNSDERQIKYTEGRRERESVKERRGRGERDRGERGERGDRGRGERRERRERERRERRERR